MPDTDGAIPQGDCTLSDASPTEVIKKISMKEEGEGAVSIQTVK